MKKRRRIRQGLLEQVRTISFIYGMKILAKNWAAEIITDESGTSKINLSADAGEPESQFIFDAVWHYIDPIDTCEFKVFKVELVCYS